VSFEQVSGSPFSVQTGTTQNAYPETPVLGDFNGDGKLDLATANSHPNQCMSVLLGTGGGALALKETYDSFANGPQCGGTSAHQALAAGDLNRDGKLDLADATGDGVIVDLGRGDGTFSLGPEPAAPAGTAAVAVADLNGDGRPDLVEAGTGYDSNWNSVEFVATQLGNGDGTFQAPFEQTVDSGSDVPAIAVGNFTGDAVPDVVVAASTSLWLLSGKGDGTLQPEQAIASEATTTSYGAPFTLTTADFNGDTKLDLALGEPTSGGPDEPAVRIFLGNGQGGFTQKPVPLTLSVNQNGPGLAATDLDGDGHPDLAVALDAQDENTGDWISTVSILSGNGDGTFQPARTFATGLQQVHSIIVQDMDGDQKPDLLVGGSVPVADSYGGTVDNGRVAVLRSVTATPPLLSTGAASAVTTGAAKLAGTVNPRGQGTTWHFDYGLSSSYGSSTTPNSLAPDSSDHTVLASLSGLRPYTTYHYRLVAANGGGTAQGSDRTFTTRALAAQAETDPPRHVTRTAATLAGSVDPAGAPVSYHFQYGRTPAYGAATPERSAGSGSSSVAASAQISGLVPGTVYHYRIVATGPAGTVTGYDQAFYTPRSEPQPADSYPKVAVSIGQRTALQRSIGLQVSCAEDCQATVSYLSLMLDPSGSSPLNDHQLSLSVKLDRSRRLAAGHPGAIPITLPPQWQAWIADILEHGGSVTLTATVNVIDPQGQTVPDGQVTLRVGDARAARDARPAAGDEVVPSGGVVVLDRLALSKHPRPRHWLLTISGRQTTTWHQNNDEQQGTCRIIAHGSGAQTIRFDSSHPVEGYIGMSPGGIPLAANLDASTPLDLPVNEQIDREGTWDAGMTGTNCHGFSGGGGGGMKPDCGRRSASTVADMEWLGPRDLHAGEDANYELLHPHGQLYQDCPFMGLDNAISAYDLWPAHDPDFPPNLVLTNTAQRHIVETIRANDHETIPGGYANTQVIYNVTLQLLDCPPPLPGGLSAVCVDEKTKRQAQADSDHYQQEQQYDERAIKVTCHSPSGDPNDLKGTALACLVNTVKDGYDSHQQDENQAIANDPPDPRYRRVARARPASLHKQLPRDTPVAVRALVANEQQVMGVGQALATTINRVTGAYEAKNRSALRRQNRAAIRYARRLAGLLGDQVPLMHRAAKALAAMLSPQDRQLAEALDRPTEIRAAKQMARLLRGYVSRNS
jgi:hypothetical protein